MMHPTDQMSTARTNSTLGEHIPQVFDLDTSKEKEKQAYLFGCTSSS